MEPLCAAHGKVSWFSVLDSVRRYGQRCCGLLNKKLEGPRAELTSPPVL